MDKISVYAINGKVEISTNFKGNDIVVGFPMTDDEGLFKRRLNRALHALKNTLIDINSQEK